MIQSIRKAANILEFMKEQNREYSVAEISESIEYPPSTTHRILNTLINCGYVAKDERTHLYKLGSGLISLGLSAISNINIQNEASPILKDLSEKTGEDSFLIIRSGNNGIVISKSEGPHPLKIVENFGIEIPLHKGAIRKVILAYQPKEFIEAYMQRDLEPYLENTEIDKVKLMSDLEKIRKNKISVSISEYIQNAVGIGAPVFDYKNEFIASMGIVAPQDRAEETGVDFIQDSIREHAEILSKKLGNYSNMY
ncbi:IclR family transcriptional regulator [Anaerosphaera multitolerans]|uniref:Glycerol operon regulatory protein n=1 Tax=Anaerosphaera multitolerans TaxID=2487351 RepID=A0A437S4S7_9FIRM|nr:IclR family transcriptional regulator [Anaerosphaera multitolerans]RVU53966.1 IclR family transcriptional regulator [Anaerosphaera multitolerans]